LQKENKLTQYQKDLVTAHFNVVAIIVDKLLSKQGYRHFRWMRDELLSEGYYALTRAATKFKEDGGASFVTYASRLIHGYVVNLAARQWKRDSQQSDIDLKNVPMEEYEEPEEDPYRLSLIEELEPYTEYQKDIFYKLIIDGQTSMSLAKERGVSEAAVKAAKLKLIKKFRKELGVKQNG
jgi:RNA polymerase sigma factor (sigma-70 family)